MNDRENMNSVSSLMLYSSKMVSVLCVYLCVVSVFMLLGNCDGESVTMFFLLGMNPIPKLYSSSINIHCIT